MHKLGLLFRVIWSALWTGSTRAFYDRICSFYDHLFTDHVVHVENIVALLTALYAGEEGLLLDLGCGTGLLSKALSKQGFHVIGMDISMNSLEVLQRSEEGIPLVQANAESSPFIDRCFQVVACLGVWRHFSDPEVILGEICRTLSDSGTFILGYFPPRLGGVFYIRDNIFGRSLVSLYCRMVHWLGYIDQIQFDLEKQALQAIHARFNHVRKIESGKHWYLILASGKRREFIS